jgi:hypothetical protein
MKKKKKKPILFTIAKTNQIPRNKPKKTLEAGKMSPIHGLAELIL